jgi:magnesium chelatase family protein
LAGHAALGELALDGRVRPVLGAPAVAEGARRDGLERILRAAESYPEAMLAGIEAVPVRHLAEAAAYLRGEFEPEPYVAGNGWSAPAVLELADVRGQERARRALELAAAAGHNLLLAGPPGIGKTMLGRRLPGILPPLSEAEALEVTRIHSVAGLLAPGYPLVTERPFRAPTTAPRRRRSWAERRTRGRAKRASPITACSCSTSCPSSSVPRSRHSGSRSRTAQIAIARVGGRALFPARFQLVGTINL